MEGAVDATMSKILPSDIQNVVLTENSGTYMRFPLEFEKWPETVVVMRL